jgi:hypothetical protein
MDFSSLPHYPSTVRPASPAPGKALSPRLTKTLLSLTLLSGVAAVIYVFWPIIDAIVNPPTPTVPLDFQVIQQRFDELELS